MTDRALADALTRHQIYLQRYAAGRVNAALPFIRRLARELRARVAEDDLTTFQAMRLTAMQRDLERIAAGTLAAVEQQLTLDLEGLAEYEAQWANRILAGAVVVDTAAVAPELVRAAITTAPMKLLSGDEVREVTIQQAFREFAGSIAQDVRQTVQAGIVTGEATPNIARQVSSLVDNRTRRQAETLVRTVTNHAGNTARMEVWKRNADIITHEKFAATLDGRTTLQCFPGQSPVTPIGVIEAAYRRPYEGEVVVITTSLSNEIRATPNHPVLTARGWLPANKIEPGHEVFGPFGADRFSILGSEYVRVPSEISDIFDSLHQMAGVDALRVGASAEEFHGDVSGVDDEVDVLFADGDLCTVVNAERVEDGRKFHFGLCEDGVFLLGDGFCDRLFLRRRPVSEPAQVTSTLTQGGVKPAFGSRPRDGAEDHRRPHSAVEHPDGVRLISVDELVPLSAFEGWHRVELLEEVCNRGSAGFEVAGDLAGGHAPSVQSQDVVSVRREHMTGHVYNLQTSRGKYICGGIIVHNCSGNDGKVSPLGTGPRPPLHWACRSVTLPVVRANLRIPGLDSKRSSIDGPVDASLTYDGFLRRQDESFQNDVLGPERAKLFRAGMPVSRFTDASGRTYTLAELRAIDAIASK